MVRRRADEFGQARPDQAPRNWTASRPCAPPR